MEYTSDQLIPWPTSEDYGNGPLDLQLVAQAADARMAALETGFNAALRPETLILGLSAAVTGIPVSTNVTILWNTVVYNNGWNTVLTVGLGGSYVPILPPRSGAYLCGCYIDSSAASITAASLRRVAINITANTGPSPITDTLVTQFQTSISDPGSSQHSYLTDQGLFTMVDTTTNPPRTLTTTFIHTNATVMTVNTGSYFWITRLSNLDS